MPPFSLVLVVGLCDMVLLWGVFGSSRGLLGVLSGSSHASYVILFFLWFCIQVFILKSSPLRGHSAPASLHPTEVRFPPASLRLGLLK